MGKEIVEYWKPKHDQVVSLHLAGYSNIRIGQIIDYTPEYVSAILCDPRALAAVMEFQRRIRDRSIEDIENYIVELAEKSIRNIAVTVEHEFDPGSKGKEHQDAVGFKLLACLGYDGQRRGEQRVQPIQMSREMEERLVNAMEKTREVDMLIAEAEEVEVLEDAATIS